MKAKIRLSKNAIAYICAAVMLIVILIVFFVCGPLNKKKEHFSMTKQEFITLAESGDDEELLESAFDWTENFCPIVTKKFSKASKPVQYVQAMLHFHYEVLNGGFPQFYYNGYHTHGFDYKNAFKAANLEHIADLFVRAQECFERIKHTMPTDSSLESFSKWYENNPLNDLDDEYAEQEEEIIEGIAEYIKNNISYFGDYIFYAVEPTLRRLNLFFL